MFADQFVATIAAAPARALDDVTRAFYKALAVGQFSDPEAEAIDAAITARRTLLKAAPPRPGAPGGRPSIFPPRRPRPVFDRSKLRERRRRHARSRWLPDHLANHFTDGEVAALAIVAQAVSERGRCEYPISRIAALAGVGETTVRTALREAVRRELIVVEHRPQRGAKHLPNLITITSGAWQAWIVKRPVSLGGDRVRESAALGATPRYIPPTPKKDTRSNGWKGKSGRRRRPAGPPATTAGVAQ